MIILSLLVTLLFVCPAHAQSNYSSLIISNEVKEEAKEQDAINQAKILSKRNIENLKTRTDNIAMPNNKKIIFQEKTSTAPFGLLWGASSENIQNLGVALKQYNLEDTPNSYSTTYLPKPIAGFENVIISFGENNKLWRILAYGTPTKDDANASEILSEYKKYYRLLEKKYGNAEEFYVGATQKIVEGKVEKTIVEKIGNENFLSQLQSGQAELYATFYNENVGASLSVNVDGDNNAYLIIDYKNIKIFDANEKNVMDAL